jgi:hypothetical protein
MRTHAIAGRWKVVRESGKVPPGLRISVKPKQKNATGSGWAKLGAIPIGRFRIAGSTFEHRLLPLAEQLELRKDGAWHGRMLWRGKELGLFRLEPLGG